jgi:hypothetical protein
MVRAFGNLCFGYFLKVGDVVHMEIEKRVPYVRGALNHHRVLLQVVDILKNDREIRIERVVPRLKNSGPGLWGTPGSPFIDPQAQRVRRIRSD